MSMSQTPSVDLNALPHAALVAMINQMQQQTSNSAASMPSSSEPAPANTSQHKRRRPGPRHSRSSAEPGDVSECGDSHSYCAWAPTEVEILLDTLYDIAVDGGASDAGFKEAAMQQAAIAIEQKTHVVYTTRQIRTKFYWLKGRWACIKFLDESSGIELDRTTLEFNATDEVWDALLKAHPSQHMSALRSGPVEFFEKMERLFSVISYGASGEQGGTVEDKIARREARVSARSATGSVDSKKEKKPTPSEAIIALGESLGDPQSAALRRAYEALASWYDAPEEKRGQVNDDTLDAIADDFVYDIPAARAFACRSEPMQLRLLKRKQAELGGEIRDAKRRRTASHSPDELPRSFC